MLINKFSLSKQISYIQNHLIGASRSVSTLQKKINFPSFCLFDFVPERTVRLVSNLNIFSDLFNNHKVLIIRR